MGDTKLIDATQVKEGTSIILEGVACKVVSVEISRPGKHGHAKVRIGAVGLVDDKKRIVVMPGHDSLEVPIIGKKNAQVLSVKDKMANVMDQESFETFDIPIPDELKEEVVEGVNILYWIIMDQKIMKQIVKGA